ncbi:DUF695 domain-containing protein [Chitinophagaceae bacterium 26-R-25]|nr:DUF695 domain-containing protein [Chitinophagaceae bacterium 26-R-25]
MSLLKKNFKKKVTASYEDFWTWFCANEQMFFKIVETGDNIQTDFFDQLSPQLDKIKETIYYVAGMHTSSIAELAFAADGEIENIVFIEELVAAAPALPNWKFAALKPAVHIDDINLEISGYKFTKEKLHFFPNHDPDFPDEIDVTIVFDDFNEEDKTAISTGVYIFMDNFLGELNATTTIDLLTIAGKDPSQTELIPIEKLKDYLVWREKEFIERYEETWRDTEKDEYSGLSAKLPNGNEMVAVINTSLINWDNKPSHPWILTVKIEYDGRRHNGMPDKKTTAMIEELESELSKELPDAEGFLNFGNQTGGNKREIYFVCKDFRRPSKILNYVSLKHAGKMDLSFDIYKDKYWRTFSHFVNALMP